MPRQRPSSGLFAVPIAFALVKLVLHALAVTNYGYFRDELYYIACSKHLAWGYVDHPPLSIALLALNRALLGDSLIALRWAPAVAGATVVLLTGFLVRRLGGGHFAAALACLCAVLAPVWLIVDHFYSMNALDTLFWTLGSLLFLRALDGPRRWTWLGLGLVLGLGTLNKHSMLWFGAGAFLGIALTPYRRLFATPWPWAAGVLAALLVLPHVVWQASAGWPTVEFMRNASGSKMVHTGFAAFWGQQILAMGPGSLPIWLVGWGALWAWRPARPYAILFFAVAALLVATGSSRPNYLAVAFAPLFAAGAVMGERWTAPRRRAWIRPLVLVAVGGAGLVILPIGLPLQPVEQRIAYARALHIQPRSQEHTRTGDLPQVLADMFGWEELTRKVAGVYRSLPAADQARCSIYTSNYGEAGAIDFFGPRWGLPPAISGHNNYWLWGPGGGTGEVMILVGGSRDDPHRDFQSVVLADTTDAPHAMPYENGAPIFLCRGLSMPLAARWPGTRHYE